jgi:PD-(D/E)XK nuclease superfamily
MTKPFSWSYSKLKNFNTCPFKYLKVDVQKAYREDTAQLDYGNKVHGALSQALVSGKPLPDEFDVWQHWVTGIRSLPGELMVEQKYAITREFQPCEYFGPKVWYRGIADAVKIDGHNVGIFDWKTGKVRPDSVQLMLMTACVFAFHPELEQARTSFIWLNDNEITSSDFTRQDIRNAWPAVLEQVSELEAATERMLFPPKPGGLCINYCPVSVCEFYKKGARR